jgi:hypothetical protein
MKHGSNGMMVEKSIFTVEVKNYPEDKKKVCNREYKM